MPSSSPGLTPLSLAEARRIAEGAMAKAKELNIRISVAVADIGGRLTLVNRMDAALWATVHGAKGKALASAAFNLSTRRLSPGPDEQDVGNTHKHIRRAEGQHMLFAQGGVAIFRDGVAIGSCGVEGGTGAQDEECARAGIAKVVPYEPPRGARKARSI